MPRTPAILSFVLAASLSCGDSTPPDPPPSSVTVTLRADRLGPGDTTRAAVQAKDAGGKPLAATPTLASSNEGVARVDQSGLVTAVAVGSATITATVRGVSGNALVTVEVPVASVRITPESVYVAPGATLQLAAKAYDAAGVELAGRPITWATSDDRRVSVSLSGLLTWRGPGGATITASSSGRSDTAKVSTGGDIAVASVLFTQGVQDVGGTIPLIEKGGAAAALVFLTTAISTSVASRIELRVLDAAGTVVHTASTTSAGTIEPTFSLSSPHAAFLIPTTLLKPNLSWRVMRDGNALPDDSSANDALPRAGSSALNTATTPALNVRFVPIALSAHGGYAPSLSEGDLPGYMETALSSLPLGEVNAGVGSAFSTSASFGTAPSGGASSFFIQVLNELDVARLADPTAGDAHWYGVVAPPPGFTFTQFGGYAFVPADPRSTGPSTRTAVGVRTGWFSNQTQARDLVAHELSHNFGRRHAPCGGPANVDSSYPFPDGRINEWMHDVFGWARGGTLMPVAPTRGDVMSYCWPVWTSVYTHRGILAARGPAAAAYAPASQLDDVLALQGWVRRDGTAQLLAPLAIRARVSLPDGNGPYRLEGFDTTGALLFRHSFTPAAVDHEPDVRLFTFTIPRNAMTARLHMVRLTGPSTTSAVTMGAQSRAAMQLDRDGLATIDCGPGVRAAVQAADGRLLGFFAHGARFAPRTTVSVACAGDARTRRISVPPR